MKRTSRLKSLLLLILVSTVFISFGCILDPREDPKPPPIPDADWGDLTEKEDIIENLVKSYTYRDINKYTELLRDDYVWFLQEGDIEPGGEDKIERDNDIIMTTNMFKAANGLYEPVIERLTLSIEYNEWVKETVIGDIDPCEDCWSTERIYHIQAVIGETTYYSDDLIQVYIVKNTDTGKYGIKIIYDVPAK